MIIVGGGCRESKCDEARVSGEILEVRQPLIVSLAPKARASSNDLYKWIFYAEIEQFLYGFFFISFLPDIYTVIQGQGGH
jgi:hypothetical protein